MAQQDEPVEDLEFAGRAGDDSAPLMVLVHDRAPGQWGSLTSQPRTTSAAYVRFLQGAREARDAKHG